MLGNRLWLKSLLAGMGWNGLATMVKAGAHIALNKLIALNFGPAGLGLFAHLLNLFNMLILLPQQGIGRAIVKELSTTASSHKYLRWASTLAYFSVWATFIAVLFLQWLNSHWISSFVDTTTIEGRLWWLFFLLATLLFARQQVWQAFLQSQQAFRSYALVGVLGTVSGLLLFYTLMPYGIAWATVGFLTGLSLSVYPSIKYAQPLLGTQSAPIQTSVKSFTPYMLLALLSLVSSNVLYGIRSFSLASLGQVATGYWQVPFTISQYMVVALQALFLTAFYPKIAQLNQAPIQFYRLVFQIALMAMLSIGIGLWIFYQMSPMLIPLLFNDALAPALPLFSIHLYGDFFMLMSNIGVYIWLSLGKVKPLIAQQLATNALQVVGVYVLFATLEIKTFSVSYLAAELVGCSIIWGALLAKWRMNP